MENGTLKDIVAEKECWFWIGEDCNHNILSEIKAKAGMSRDFRAVILDSNTIQTPDDFWNELFAQLNIPAEYGDNFDALKDYLCELPFEEYGTIEFVHYVFYIVNLDFSSDSEMIYDLFALLMVLNAYAFKELSEKLRFTLLLELPAHADQDAPLSASKWRPILFRRHKALADNQWL